jgi:hypothetical protein
MHNSKESVLARLQLEQPIMLLAYKPQSELHGGCQQHVLQEVPLLAQHIFMMVLNVTIVSVACTTGSVCWYKVFTILSVTCTLRKSLC